MSEQFRSVRVTLLLLGTLVLVSLMAAFAFAAEHYHGG